MDNTWVNLTMQAIEQITYIHISEEDLERFLEDDEHGVEHSLLVSYWATIFKEHDPSNLLACLCHDIARFSHGDYNHDKNLMYVMDYLPKITYEHISPSHVTSFIRADRMDLIRFDNAVQWVSPKMVPEIADITNYRQIRNNIITSEEYVNLSRQFINKLWQSRID